MHSYLAIVHVADAPDSNISVSWSARTVTIPTFIRLTSANVFAAQLAVSRLQAIFRTCLLRRMKNTKLDGKPLIDLPEKVVELTRLIFSEEERSVYTQVETRTQNQFNRFLRAGTVLK